MDDSSRVAKRDYMRKYDRDHRVELRAKARDRRHARMSRVNARALKAARENPRYEQERGIRNYVICRVSGCGAKAKSLTPAHLRELHKMTTAQFAKEFPDAPLASLALREKFSAILRSAPRRFPLVPGHPGEAPLRPWLIVDPASKGKPYAEIGRDLNRRPETIRKIAYNSFGMAAPRRHDLGTAVTNARALKLLEATGLDSRRFGEIFGISRGLAMEILRPRSAGYRIGRAQAEAIITARDRLLRDIASLAQKTAHRWGPNSTRMLRSMIPDLRAICRALRTGLAVTRRFLRRNPEASIADWQDWLCSEARGEIERGTRVRPFASFLPLAAELSQFIAPEFAALRSRGRIVYVAARILAERLGVTYSHCIHAERARPLSPPEVKSWILEARHSRHGAPAAAVEEPRNASQNKGGRPAVMSKKTLWRISVIAALKKLNRWSEENFKLVYPDTPASASANARAHASRHKKRVLNLEQRLTVADAQAILQEPKPA
jgi:hypothetical protein